jgi:formylglycine-generating enzyme required for sulfatase activity
MNISEKGMAAYAKGPLTPSAKIKFAKPRHPDLVTISAGSFIMGISDDLVEHLVWRDEWAAEWYEKDMFMVEQPEHRLPLPAFEIARYPVTNFEYHKFVWATGYRVPRGWLKFQYVEGTDTHPVVGISYEDTLEYCKWINKMLGPGPGGSLYRLPTEAEWERAARGDDGRLFPWGDEFDPWRCNTVEGGKRGTTACGEYSPIGDSPWGLSDMAGNVYEWTASRLSPYPYDPADGREAPGCAGTFVIRGGAWYYSSKLARCTAREGVMATFVSSSLGFRLARTVKEPGGQPGNGVTEFHPIRGR